MTTRKDTFATLDSTGNVPLDQLGNVPPGGVADILDLPTAETDTTLVLAPDGVGGVEFRAESGGSVAASAVTNTPAGNISATDVQAALNELDTEKSATSHTHATYALATPTAPAIRSVSAEATGTGNVTPTLPAGHTTNDILLLIVQSANQAVAAPAGYTQVGPRCGVGVAAASGSTYLAVFWKRDGGAESDPTVLDSGNRTYATMLAISGCPTTGDPFWFMSNYLKPTANSAGSAFGGATTVANCLIVTMFAHGISSASGQMSGSATNADLSSVTTQFNDSSTDGVGGGLTVISGVKATAGTFGATTLTWSASTADVQMCLAFVPADATPAPHPVDVQVFANTDTSPRADTWTKPSGAREVEITGIASGGPGSAGRNAATAAGGGGGGGGEWGQRTFRATDLAATLTVNPGATAAETANTDGSTGSAVNVTTVVNGSTTILSLTAGRAGTASATGSGGAGGAGGGSFLSSSLPAAGTPLDYYGSQPPRGGTGATTGAIGSSSNDTAGGGGGGGSTSAGSSTGGSARLGGGGGGGGHSNTAFGAGGPGGGAVGGASVGAAGNSSAFIMLGGGGGAAGNSATGPGGAGGFPGGGGGGGGTVSGSQRGGAGAAGVVVIITRF
jgi:hypothetical protein